MENREKIEKYWQNKAQELGESILYKSIAQGFQSGRSERFGILYLTDTYLIFEYSRASRKSILESIFSKPRGEDLNQVIKIPRKQIKLIELLALNRAKKWMKRAVSPKEIMASSDSRRSSPVWRILTGACLAVCTDDLYLAFNTPVNREWLTILTRKNPG